MHNKVTGRIRTGFTEVYAQSVTLTFDLATWFLFTHTHTHTHTEGKLYALPPFYFQTPSCTAKLWPGHDSGTHTHTHTHTEGKLYMPLRHFMTGLNELIDGRKLLNSHCSKPPQKLQISVQDRFLYLVRHFLESQINWCL